MMKLLKKLLISSLCCLMAVFGTFTIVVAEEDYESNSTYYSNLCSKSDLSEEEKVVCKGYADYMSNKSQDLRDQLNEIEAKRDEIKKDIQNQVKKIKEYETQISQLGREIAQLNSDIKALQVQIDEKAAEIVQKEAEKEALMQKVKDRMEKSQGTMRLNQYLDFIMGAESLTDLIRRVNGINDLMDYDNQMRIELNDLIVYLNEIKAQLEIDKQAVEDKKADVEKKQASIIVKQKEAEIIKQEWLAQELLLEEQGNQIAGDLSGIKDKIAALNKDIANIPSSYGFSKPVKSGSARVSAGTWHYPQSFGGGVHLGLDLAAGIGTTVMAVANGVIIKSVDGCPNGSGLGSSCGGAQGGTSGGGNQIIMLSKVDGVLYAIKYLHLNPGSLVGNYQTVMAGDKIAEIGSSGNASGAHLHIEVYKLGNQSINDYIASWDGNLSFGCGWGSSALNRTCSNSGAPCRMRPEEALGY